MTSHSEDTVRFQPSHETAPSDTLVAGVAEYGLAGLTAANFLVEQLDLDPVGHVAVEGFSTITPFEDGRPRRPMRLFGDASAPVSVLASDQFLPVSVAERFGDDLVDWLTGQGVEEVAVCSGVPVAHGPEDHRTFYVATDDFRERRLADGDVPPMGNGFLDGVNAALVQRGLAGPLGVGVLVTPVHQRVPDVEAALRLVETVTAVYDLDVDTAPLRAFAEQVGRYYENLAARMEDVDIEDQPEDRMYM